MNDDRLTAPERAIWWSHVTGTMELTAHLDRLMRRATGMPMTYFQILGLLAAAPGRRMRMSELAAAAGSSTSRLSHAVAALEKSEWVEREPAACDRRGWSAALTDAGLAAYEAAVGPHGTFVRRYLFDVLTPAQIQALDEIGAAIRAGLDTACTEARAREDIAAACTVEPGSAPVDRPTAIG